MGYADGCRVKGGRGVEAGPLAVGVGGEVLRLERDFLEGVVGECFAEDEGDFGAFEGFAVLIDDGAADGGGFFHEDGDYLRGFVDGGLGVPTINHPGPVEAEGGEGLRRT
jgi:hypothetical protein